MVNDMVYGGNMQNLISSRVKIRVPIWCNEGLAEFLSLNWNANLIWFLEILQFTKECHQLMN